MECPVCYEHASNCTLVCGHKFCKSCVKTWYTKGNGSAGCPMCRRRVHYRRMPVKKWALEAEETRKEQVYQDAFDSVINEIVSPTSEFIVSPTHQLEDIERTYRALKDVATADEIDFILFETADYYSDRRVNLYKRTYSEMGHWYPFEKHRGGMKKNFFKRNK